MNAVTIKPRMRKEPATSTSRKPPPVYVRPVHKYVRPKPGTPVSERIETLRAALYEADEKIEGAYDSAECGSASELLLDHIAHDLLCDAVRPILRNEDEAHISFTNGDADTARGALFTVLAALEGAMALSLGSMICSTLAEAFLLLDWAQDELEDLALHRLLPEVTDGAQAANAGLERLALDDRDQLLDDASAHYGHALAVVRSCCRDTQLCGLVWAAKNLMEHEDRCLIDALRSEDLSDIETASAAISVIVDLLSAAAHATEDSDDALMWAAHTLAGLAHARLEVYIEAKVKE